MSEKVKLTQQQADALEKMFELGINTKSRIIELHVKLPDGWKDHCTPLNDMDLDDLITAIYIGYEVEQTPEDKVRKTFEYALEQIEKHDFGHGDNQNAEHWKSLKSGIIFTLESLNIKIKGVNDHE
jgi:hypothetical protein